MLFHCLTLESIKDEFVQIAPQTQVNEPPQNNEDSPCNDDLLDTQDVQQHALIKGRARTFGRKLKPSWKLVGNG